MGQISFTSVRGTITDPSGAIVPGAKVVLANVANGQTTSQFANEQGEYRFPATGAGHVPDYGIEQRLWYKNKKAELLVDQPATVNFSLTIQSSDCYGGRKRASADMNDSRCDDRQRAEQRDNCGAAQRRSERA